jgi:hypothetical protein
MATKTTDRPLMRQKVNVSPELLEKWKAEYLFDIRHIIHGSLLTPEDLGTTFTHQERTFEIVGMGNGRTVMLRETREEGVFYWETTRPFVQQSLNRFNRAFTKLPNGKTTLTNMSYEPVQLVLAPKNTKRRKPVVEEEEVIVTDNEIQLEVYNEEDHDIADETETETELF